MSRAKAKAKANTPIRQDKNVRWKLCIVDYKTGDTKMLSQRSQPWVTAMLRAERKAHAMCTQKRSIYPMSNGYTIGTTGCDPRWGVHLIEVDNRS